MAAKKEFNIKIENDGIGKRFNFSANGINTIIRCDRKDVAKYVSFTGKKLPFKETESSKIHDSFIGGKCWIKEVGTKEETAYRQNVQSRTLQLALSKVYGSKIAKTIIEIININL